MKLTVKWFWSPYIWVWSYRKFLDHNKNNRYELDVGPLMITLRKK